MALVATRTPFAALIAASVVHARNNPNLGSNLKDLPSQGRVTTRRYRYNPLRVVLGSEVVYDVTQVDLDRDNAQRTFRVTIEEIEGLLAESGE